MTLTNPWLVAGATALIIGLFVHLVWGNLADKLGFACWVVLVLALVVAVPWYLGEGAIPALLTKIAVVAVVVLIATELWGVGSGRFTHG